MSGTRTRGPKPTGMAVVYPELRGAIRGRLLGLEIWPGNLKSPYFSPKSIEMTKIIGIIQVKGGAGRSTASTNLAGELSKQGKTVLIGCDIPQGTSASWLAVSQQSY